MKLTKTAKAYKDMIAIGKQFAKCLHGNTKPVLLTLQGQPDAGKTSLSRGIILGLGYEKPIISPGCFPNEYKTSFGNIYHCDLYKVKDVQQLHDISFYEKTSASALSIVEWSNRLKSLGVKSDIFMTINKTSEHRVIGFNSNSKLGYKLLTKLKAIP